MISIIAALSFKEGKNEETGKNISDLEETLKRVLENTEVKASAVSGASIQATPGAAAPTAGGGDAGSGDAEVLKTELAEKEVEIMNLKDQIADLEKNGGGNTVELETKLKDLEAKLQEYEIIEDDIANLSLYKQENAKLKQEIEALKSSGGGAAPEPAPAPAPAPVAEAAPEEAPQAEEAKNTDDDIMAEFAAAVEDQKAVETGEAPAGEEAGNADDDIMAEFAAAVEDQKATESGEAPAQKEEAAEDDIMAEFAAAVEDQKAVESGEEPLPEKDSD